MLLYGVRCLKNIFYECDAIIASAVLFFDFAVKEFSLCKRKGILQKVKTNNFRLQDKILNR